MAGNSADPGRTVTSKLCEILLMFSGGGEFKLAEIANCTNLPTSTTHRLVSQMVTWRLLERTEDRRYRTGISLRMMANDYARSDSCSYAHPLYARTVLRALPVLHQLSTATRSIARLGVLRGADVLLLGLPSKSSADCAHAEGLQQSVLPAHASAAGKALLAFAPPRTVDEVIAAGLHHLTRHTITSADTLRNDLSIVRLTQMATSACEVEPEMSAIACPIFYGGGRVAAAIELTNRGLGRETEPAASALSIACRSLSRQLATDLHRADSQRSHHRWST